MLAVLHFQSQVRGCPVLVRTDNIASKAHVNRKGGTHSRSLMKETSLLFHWAELNLASLKLKHLYGHCDSRLDKPPKSQRGRVATESSSVQGRVSSLQSASDRYVWLKSTAQVGRFFALAMGEGAEASDAFQTLWPQGLLLYAFPPFSLIPLKKTGVQGSPNCTTMVQTSLVSRSVADGKGSGLDFPSTTRPTKSGSPGTSSARSIQTDLMAAERQALSACGYSFRVLNTWLSSRRVSTNQIYGCTWRKFWFGVRESACPISPSTGDILEFLQDVFDLWLSVNTLKRQLATLNSVLTAGGKQNSHPHIWKFLRRVFLLKPPMTHRFPTSDLHKVLTTLMGKPLALFHWSGSLLRCSF